MRAVYKKPVATGSFACACLFAFALTAPPRVVAAEIRGVEFADSVTVGGENLRLRGTGQVKYLRMFDVYVGALYAPAGVSGDEILNPVPKRLELAYQRALSAERIVEAGELFLARNAGGREIARLRPSLDAINALYRDVVEGDRYALTYQPGTGTTLTLNGEVLGTISGDDFAGAYYRIWFGVSPVSEDFRDRVLGDANAGGGPL